MVALPSVEGYGRPRASNLSNRGALATYLRRADALRLRRRFQDSFRPDVFLYYRDYSDLPQGNTTIVVVARFGSRADGTPNNFVLTAYQVLRRARG